MPLCLALFVGSIALAVALAAAPAGASPYAASIPIAVSGDSPFADCTADHDPENPLVLGQEAEPFVAVNPLDPDHIVGSWIQDQWLVDGNGRGLGVAASFDGGKSWQTTVMPGLSLCSGGELPYSADPWLDFGPDGSLYHIGIPFRAPLRPFTPETRFDIVVNTSSDGGLSWSDPISLSVSGYPVRGNDKESITADPFDANYVYATWAYFSPGVVGAERRGRGVTRFTRSTDGGATWEEPRTTFDPVDYGGFDTVVGHRILVLPDGTLVNLAENYPSEGGPSLLVQRSSDQGETWTPTDATAKVLPLRAIRGTAPDDGFLLPYSGMYAAVDRSTGDLFVVWGEDLDEGVVKAHFSMSTDAGRTWSEPIVVSDTPGGRELRSQSFLPAVAVTGDGTVGVMYYDFRFDDEGTETWTDVWLAHCHARTVDCAERGNWDADARVTEASFDLKGLPPNQRVGVDRYFPGHYMGLTATEHDFLAFYVQPRDGDPGSVFFSRIAPVVSSCAGNCNGDDRVAISELILLVNIALEETDVSTCQAGDTDRDGVIAINELVAAVNAALRGCGSVAETPVAHGADVSAVSR